MEREKEKADVNYRTTWTQIRWLASAIINIWSKKTIRPERLISFPWEKKAIKRSTMTREEALEAIRNHEKLGVI